MSINALVSGVGKLASAAVRAGADEVVETGARTAGKVPTELAGAVVPPSQADLLADLLRMQVRSDDGMTFAQRTAREVAGASGRAPDAELVHGVSNIANKLGFSEDAVRAAIHTLKEGKIAGARTNGDVLVDVRSGETFLQKANGRASGDALGNLLDVLRR